MTVRFIPELAGITPYQPGLPIEVVQRRFGLERVVKLASNEFPLPPFPEVKEVVIGGARPPAAVSGRLLHRPARGAGGRVRPQPRADHRRLRHLRAAVPARPRGAGARRRGRARAAVVHVLPRRHRHPRRRPRGRPAAGLHPRPRGHGRGRHAAHQDDLRVQPEQPDRDLRALRRGRAARRTRPGRRAGRHRRGVHRVRHRRGPRGLPGHPEGARQRRRAAHLLQDLRALRPAHRLRHLRARGEAGRRQGAAALQRQPARAAGGRRGAQAPGQGGGAPRDQRAAPRPHGGAARGARPRHGPHARPTSCSST